MLEKGKTITIRLVDDWPDSLAIEVGRIGIAFAQLTREVYLAAKRKHGAHLPEWEAQHPSDNLSRWIHSLRRDFQDDLVLMNLVDRAKEAARQRDDIFHAIWGRHTDGHINRWRRQTGLGLELEPLQALLCEIRAVRDEINRHTRVRDKYTLKQTVGTGI